MEQITSLVITKKGPSCWICVSNLGLRSEDAYTGGLVTEDKFLIKAFNGGIIYRDVYFGVIKYYDELDPTNNLTNASSGTEMMVHLSNVNFFVGSAGGSSSPGGVSAFKQLSDVNLPGGFLGRNGYYIAIDDAGQFLEAVPFPSLNIQDLNNVLFGNLLPNKYLLTSNITNSSGYSTGVVLGDIDTIVNTPIPAGEFRIVAKGYIETGSSEPYTYIPNQESFVLEQGDFCEHVSLEDGKKYDLRYVSGNPDLLASYEIIGWKKISIPGEPSY